MKVLVLNAGSSSLKFRLTEIEAGRARYVVARYREMARKPDDRRHDRSRGPGGPSGRHHVRGSIRVPAVIEGGRLVGIVTERDVLKALAATLPAVRGMDPDSYLW